MNYIYVQVSGGAKTGKSVLIQEIANHLKSIGANVSISCIDGTTAREQTQHKAALSNTIADGVSVSFSENQTW